jgi:hypothetical protein
LRDRPMALSGKFARRSVRVPCRSLASASKSGLVAGLRRFRQICLKRFPRYGAGDDAPGAPGRAIGHRVSTT